MIKSKLVESTDVAQFQALMDTALNHLFGIKEIKFSTCIDPISNRKIMRSALIIYEGEA